MDKDIRRIIQKLEELDERTKKLESLVEKEPPKKEDKKFSGLTGGIKFLIKSGFFVHPKSVEEVKTELEREGYYYPYTSVDKILRVNFTKNKKILTRLKANKVWKYVQRK